MGVWIETKSMRAPLRLEIRHTLYGCVDWNLHLLVLLASAGGHTLYGCVDWNNIDYSYDLKVIKSHPVWVCGLKLILQIF